MCVCVVKFLKSLKLADESFVLRIVNIFFEMREEKIARPTQICFLLSFRN